MIRLCQADAFAGAPFGGNPAAVCVLDGPAPDEWMQNLAAEMNLSETAFLVGEKNTWSLRWFTPAVEVSLCGHATLASAHILWTSGLAAANQPIVFSTLSGDLTARRDGSLIELDFPARLARPCPPNIAVNAAIGIEPTATLVFEGPNGDQYLLELETAAQVRDAAPDFAALAATGARAVVVTARSDTPDYDFVSRFFGPNVGIDEDPVTGSAHCTLAPYWEAQFGRSPLVGFQASERGGIVHCRTKGDRVVIAGTAVTVFTGELAAAAGPSG